MPKYAKHFLNSHFHDNPIEEILQSSPAALYGVSEADATRLNEAFGVDSIAELANNRYFHHALALQASSGAPSHDPGPSAQWAAFFANAPLDFYLNHPAGRFRMEFGPVYYRGRLDDTARILIVGQDPSTNEILAQRAFVGASGQRIQRLLNKLGIDRSYVMVNTFLYSVYGQFDSELKAISTTEPLMGYRNALLDRIVDLNPIELVVAFGSGAAHAIENWPGHRVFNYVHLHHPAANSAPGNWNGLLSELANSVEPDDISLIDLAPYGSAFTETDHVDIPRYDLAFGIPDWHGTQRGVSHRNGANEIIWQAP